MDRSPLESDSRLPVLSMRSRGTHGVSLHPAGRPFAAGVTPLSAGITTCIGARGPIPRLSAGRAGRGALDMEGTKYCKSSLLPANGRPPCQSSGIATHIRPLPGVRLAGSEHDASRMFP